jgi:polysaccharide export outer membrane protein
MARDLLALVVALAVCGFLKGQQPEGPKPTASVSRSGEATGLSSPAAAASCDYLINPEDVLDVYVFDIPDISHEYTVNTAGMVDFPLLPEPMKAAGLSPEQLAHSLEAEFQKSGRLRHPQITVAVKESRRSVVVVEGAVRNPQVVSVIGKTKLLYVLSEAGGVADDQAVGDISARRATLSQLREVNWLDAS